MKIREISLNGNKYLFVNEFKYNSRGFVHKTVLLKNGIEISRNTSQYYNRTWESYEFASSMKSCVWKLLEEHKKDFIRIYKKMNNIKRLSGNKKEECMELLKQDLEYIELYKLLGELDYRYR